MSEQQTLIRINVVMDNGVQRQVLFDATKEDAQKEATDLYSKLVGKVTKIRIIFSVVRYEKLGFPFSFSGRKALFFVPTLNKQFFSYRLYYDEKLFASPVR